jgi:hypothetical protein
LVVEEAVVDGEGLDSAVVGDCDSVVALDSG